MLVRTKFNLGDEVYVIKRTNRTVSYGCAACDTTGDVLIKSKRYDCPACGGLGYIYTTEGIKYSVSNKKLRIDYIQCSAVEQTDSININYSGTFDGVNSRNNYPEKYLFASYGEALIKCEELNCRVKNENKDKV